ncbi:hypothetical protein NLI96_g2166 [Meripilus lineatus]|uniref:TPR-like protein n=1 Tax=Meripilus lineatus TaxID=2056292 RepID=A0AAD5V938_9APHY|nr:hypothetical protein NLI96_g2166 [Physisporinus lineatus]
MSVRHTPRQGDRDIRLHDPHAPHGHSQPIPPSHALPHPPHLNGNSHLSTPGASGSGPSQSVAPMASSPAVTNGVAVPSSIQKLAQANEQTWLLIGRVAEQMGNLEHALSAYENALRHNPMSLPGLTQVAGIARIKENYPKAVDYFQRVLDVQRDNGEVWSALGRFHSQPGKPFGRSLSFSALRPKALYLLPNPKVTSIQLPRVLCSLTPSTKEDPKLWYGIGILYDRYGSLDHAEEAFSSVLKMDKDFDKANEILFRLGIIYKQQGKYAESLECFDRILRNPPNPLAYADIWFQIGHVYEQQRDHVRARDAYERVVRDNPGHAKVLQQLGWLYHQDGSSFQNQDLAIQYLTKSLEADPSDAQSWYLLGRAYMAGQKYNKAYEAYQQAVYRDGRNPTFWCSIGVLYFQINQYRDALDAYSRAIRINPYISEVWFDLGSLYESCNNQISDAIDAYTRAAELDRSNTAIAQRLELLRTAQATGGAIPAAPGPQDVHPTATTLDCCPVALVPALFSVPTVAALPTLPSPIPTAPHVGRSSPGPFRGGPPPPVILDDNQHPSHPQLAPMDVDRPPMHREPPVYSREGPPRGSNPSSLLLHHPVPQQQLPGEGIRGSNHPASHPHDPSFARAPIRVPSTSTSPPPSHSARPRSVVNHLSGYAEGRGPIGPGQNSVQRSPALYTREPQQPERDWDRRGPPPDIREWERADRRGRPSGDYPGPSQQPFYAPRNHSPSYNHQRASSPRARDPSTETSPRSAHPAFQRGYQGAPRSPPRRSSTQEGMEPPSRRYDPRFDGPEPQGRGYEREPSVDARFAGSPEAMRGRHPLPPPYAGSTSRASESPHVDPQSISADVRRRRGPKEKELEVPAPLPLIDAKKENRRRRPASKRVKEEIPRNEPTPYPGGPAAFKVDYRGPKSASNGSPEPVSSNGSGSASRSVQPSPTNSTHVAPARDIDEDYDEGVSGLLDLANRGESRYPPPPPPGYSRSPPNNGGRMSATSPHSMAKHPAMMMGRGSPSLSSKRPLSPGPDDHPEHKRSRVGSINRRVSPPDVVRGTPTPSTRPSPIPFRQQPTSHSPETRQNVDNSYPPSPALPTMLPPHPRPIGAGMSGMPIPSMNTRSPPNMESDRINSRSASPPRGQGKREIVLHSASTPSPSSSHGSHGKIAMV